MTTARASSVVPARVFLSYAAPDLAEVERYYFELGAASFEPYLDRYDREPRQSAHRRLEDAIAASDFFVFFLSRSSARAQYPGFELLWARQKWLRVDGRVIVVTLDDLPHAEWPPRLLGAHPLPPPGKGPALLISELRSLWDGRAPVPSSSGRSSPRALVIASLLLASLAAITSYHMLWGSERLDGGLEGVLPEPSDRQSNAPLRAAPAPAADAARIDVKTGMIDVGDESKVDIAGGRVPQDLEVEVGDIKTRQRGQVRIGGSERSEAHRADE